jgi:hypothetical protein
MIEDRIQFSTYRGHKVLFIDVSRCDPATVEAVLRKVPDVVTTQPLNSVLIFADFTGASFRDETLRVMKESAVFDKPYVKKSAWIGTEAFPPEFNPAMKTYSLRDFPVFRTRDEALEWLVKE